MIPTNKNPSQLTRALLRCCITYKCQGPKTSEAELLIFSHALISAKPSFPITLRARFGDTKLAPVPSYDSPGGRGFVPPEGGLVGLFHKQLWEALLPHLFIQPLYRHALFLLLVIHDCSVSTPALDKNDPPLKNSAKHINYCPPHSKHINYCPPDRPSPLPAEASGRASA